MKPVTLFLCLLAAAFSLSASTAWAAIGDPVSITLSWGNWRDQVTESCPTHDSHTFDVYSMWPRLRVATFDDSTPYTARLPLATLMKVSVASGDGSSAQWNSCPLASTLSSFFDPTGQTVNTDGTYYLPQTTSTTIKFDAGDINQVTPGDYVLADNEVVKLTSETGPYTFTVSRAHCGTTAVAHSAHTDWSRLRATAFHKIGLSWVKDHSHGDAGKSEYSLKVQLWDTSGNAKTLPSSGWYHFNAATTDQDTAHGSTYPNDVTVGYWGDNRSDAYDHIASN